MSSSKDNFNSIQDSIPQETKSPLQIKIIQSGKIKHYVETALSIFQDVSREATENAIIIFSGRGQAINKTITVVEIVKRKLNGSLHQYTQIGRNFLTQDEEKDDDDKMILDHEDQKKQDRSRDNLPAPVIIIYLCSKVIPHLEKTSGYQPPTLK